MTKEQKREQEILNYMKKLQLTREEAEEMWNDDNSDIVLPEVKAMEDKAKANGTKRRYEQSTSARKTTTRERKVDETKKSLITITTECLKGAGVENITIKTETEITFDFKGENYSFKLTKHRNK